MKIPFTIDDFLGVFEHYNVSIWPLQTLLYILGLIAVFSVITNRKKSTEITFSILALFWLWMGVVYHITYFSPINKAAYGFGVVFILQGIAFFYVGVIKKQIQFSFSLSGAGILGLLFILYALVIYPIAGYYTGHIYPAAPTFGVPCPTTIFTFGILLFSTNKVPWYIILIPFLWSLIGFSAALNLSVREDFGLVIAGVVSTAILLFFKPDRQEEAIIA